VIEVEGVDYVRVPVTDIEQAKDFYGRVLGLPPGPRSTRTGSSTRLAI
jgi:catechol 2,3-dioxygenase-like lactoylglutathione lyase family enzyme